MSCYWCMSIIHFRSMRFHSLWLWIIRGRLFWSLSEEHCPSRWASILFQILFFVFSVVRLFVPICIIQKKKLFQNTLHFLFCVGKTDEALYNFLCTCGTFYTFICPQSHLNNQNHFSISTAGLWIVERCLMYESHRLPCGFRATSSRKIMLKYLKNSLAGSESVLKSKDVCKRPSKLIPVCSTLFFVAILLPEFETLITHIFCMIHPQEMHMYP